MQDAPAFSAALGLLEAEIAADVAARLTPGLAVAIVHGEDTTWSRGFGYADLERRAPATANTVFAVGSITKLFTATMLMQLRDAGKLRLDDPVQAYVPEIQVPRRHPGAPPITFRHLVTHTAGLPKDAPLDYWLSREFPPAAEVIATLAETDQPYPPGTCWKYSNYGFALLGYTLARIAGQPWEDYLQTHILAPIGMTNSAARLTSTLLPLAATGYHRPVAGWPPKSLPHIDIGGIGFGGSLHSTVIDMARFIAEQFAAEPRLLPRSTIEEMQRVQWLNPDWRDGRGIAWGMHRSELGTRLEHGGGVYGFTSKVLLSPADRIGVAVFTNGSDGHVASAIASRALDLLVPVARRAAARTEPSRRADVPAAWLRARGRYRWVLGDAEFGVLNGSPVLRLVSGPNMEEVRLEPEAEGTFRMPSGPVRGERVRFLTDAEGHVTRMWVGPHPYEPVD